MTFHMNQEKFERNFAVNVHDGVENTAAYHGAVRSMILARSASKKLQVWMDEGNKDLYQWLTGTGQFDLVEDTDEEDRWVQHPMRENIFRGNFGKFLAELLDKLQGYGQLSPKQTAVVRKAFERKKEEIVQAEERREQMTKTTSFIGELDERREFTGTVEKIVSGEFHYGVWHLTVINVDGCKVVYWNTLQDKKSDYPDNQAVEGDTVTFAARIKAHEISKFDGAKQTIVSRATKVAIERVRA